MKERSQKMMYKRMPLVKQRSSCVHLYPSCLGFLMVSHAFPMLTSRCQAKTPRLLAVIEFFGATEHNRARLDLLLESPGILRT